MAFGYHFNIFSSARGTLGVWICSANCASLAFMLSRRCGFRRGVSVFSITSQEEEQEWFKDFSSHQIGLKIDYCTKLKYWFFAGGSGD
jgi:hypothetical protein